MHNNKLKQLILKNKNLYLTISSDKVKNDNDFLNAVASALNNGVQIVQLKDKISSPKRIVEIGRKLRELTSMFDALFFINGRADIAYALEVDGVHLEEEDLCVHTALEILGNNKIVGISVKNLSQLSEAIKENADYITLSDNMIDKTSELKIPYFLEPDNIANLNLFIKQGIKRFALNENILKTNPDILQKLRQN